MNAETHRQLSNDIWAICNLLRGPYKRNEYRKVILPLTVLRRFDCLLAPSKQATLEKHETVKGKPERVIQEVLQTVTSHKFYNLSKMQMGAHAAHSLLNDPNNLAPNLHSYINAFSPNVRAIMEKFKFGEQIAHMAEKNILFEVVKMFAGFDLSLNRVDNLQMGYVFEELIRIGAEQSNEEAGEHFTPREVIKLMVNLILEPEADLATSHVVKTIYDPACGTGGMLSVAEEHIRNHNQQAKIHLFGQDWNDEAWAVCKSDMLIKGEDADNIILGDTFTQDGFQQDPSGNPWVFDYMLANPPFGVEWKQQQRAIEDESTKLGFHGRFGAGTPRINEVALLFLQHMLSKMRPLDLGGSRIGIVFNGSPLFTGDAGSGESEIRRWILEHDWLDAIVAMPDQLFYNTGINTYVWFLSNRKEKKRENKVQLIDARIFFEKMRKSLGNKRHVISDENRAKILELYNSFTENQYSKIFNTTNFAFRQIIIERPLRLKFKFTNEKLEQLKSLFNIRNEDENEQQIITNKTQLKQTKKTVLEKLSKQILEDNKKGVNLNRKIKEVFQSFDNEEYLNREKFIKILDKRCKDSFGGIFAGGEKKSIIKIVGERDEAADVCLDSNGKSEPDSELRDSENVPWGTDVYKYFEKEVKPYAPDAWINETVRDHKDNEVGKVGYEIPFTRYFYKYTPPRNLEEIESEIEGVENELLNLLKQL